LDRALQALERAWRDERDLDAARELARVRLRAGRPLEALTLARVGGDRELHGQAAEALGERVGLRFAELQDGFERYVFSPQANDPENQWVLVPGGAFLQEQKARAETSLLGKGGGQRAPLKPVTVPDLLMARRPLPNLDPDLARRSATAMGARLPTPDEWKKAWRGGLYLDGDETQQRPNPHPDLISPWGLGEPNIHDDYARPYGIQFGWMAMGWWEFAQGGRVGLGFRAGHYQISLASPADRRSRQLGFRPVIELQPA
jgi:hypothetical protein